MASAVSPALANTAPKAMMVMGFVSVSANALAYRDPARQPPRRDRGFVRGRSDDRTPAQPDEDDPAPDAQRRLERYEQLRERRQAERCEPGEEGVCGCDPCPGGRTCPPSVREHALDAEHAHRPDGRGDRDSDREGPREQRHRVSHGGRMPEAAARRR